MRHILTAGLVALIAVGVGACGGGGSPSSPPPEIDPPSEPPVEPPDVVEPPDDPPEVSVPEPDPPTVQHILTGMLEQSSWVTDAGTIDGEGFLWNALSQRRPDGLTLSDLTDRQEGTYEFANLPEQHGVSQAEFVEGDVFIYAGWMEYNFFVVEGRNPIGDDPLRPTENTFVEVYSVGERSGSNPVSGGALWTGAMMGVDEDTESDTFGDKVIGTAQLAIPNFSDMVSSLVINDIENPRTGKQYPIIVWEGLVANNGVYDYALDDVTEEAFIDAGRVFGDLEDLDNLPSIVPGQLYAVFYGPSHEEFGGIFLRDQIQGAFSASR